MRFWTCRCTGEMIPSYSPYEGTGELVSSFTLVLRTSWSSAKMPLMLSFPTSACSTMSTRDTPKSSSVTLGWPITWPAAPGLGSSGVHEGGLLHISGEHRQLPGFIPTLSIVADSLNKYSRECERVINLAAGIGANDPHTNNIRGNLNSGHQPQYAQRRASPMERTGEGGIPDLAERAALATQALVSLRDEALGGTTLL